MNKINVTVPSASVSEADELLMVLKVRKVNGEQERALLRSIAVCVGKPAVLILRRKAANSIRPHWIWLTNEPGKGKRHVTPIYIPYPSFPPQD